MWSNDIIKCILCSQSMLTGGTNLSCSRPAYTPPSLVSGAGSLKKSLSLSRAKLFCTSFVKGEWKRKKSASLGGEKKVSAL